MRLGWLRSVRARRRRARTAGPMAPRSFEQVLRSAVEQGDGLVLGLASYERLIGERPPRVGGSVGRLASLWRRSRMIIGLERRLARPH